MNYYSREKIKIMSDKFSFSATPPKQGFKLLMLLAMFYLTVDLASCALAYKFVKINELFFSAETLIFPVTYTITDIIAEVYGYRIARNLIWLVLFCDFLFALSTSLLVRIPSPTIQIQETYNFVFADLLRGSTAEIAGVLCGIFTNVYAISKLKILVKGKYFWLRSIGSSSIGEAVLVLIAMPIMFLGKISTSQLLILMICSYCYKIIFAITAAYPASMMVRAVKKIEKLDVYDYNVNFNPFSVFSKKEIEDLGG